MLEKKTGIIDQSKAVIISQKEETGIYMQKSTLIYNKPMLCQKCIQNARKKTNRKTYNLYCMLNEQFFLEKTKFYLYLDESQRRFSYLGFAIFIINVYLKNLCHLSNFDINNNAIPSKHILLFNIQIKTRCVKRL